ncbi:MAG: aminoacyl-tRNA hydrolase [Bacteroidota bacterium]|nr:aminoacyl-tRNA hydrolase [Bacteroidota bacterium]
MKYLIAGLGNIGEEYNLTRHNIGFEVLDAFAKESDASFKSDKLAFTAEVKFKGRTFILIKPTTYMNLSGKAVNYYLQKEKIPLENLLVITDDISLPLGKLRLRAKGSDGGHNGLKSINEILGTTEYARLRFGVGSDFPKGRQVDYVLGRWNKDELDILFTRIPLSVELIKSFATTGLARTMTAFNSQ